MKGKIVFLAAAGLFGTLFSLSSSHLLIMILSVLFLCYLLYFKHFKKQILIMILGIFCSFSVVGYYAKIHHHTNIPQTIQTFYLENYQEPKIDGDLFQTVMIERNYKEKVLVRYKILSEKEKNLLNNLNIDGLVCKVSGTLKKPASAKNPNGFNYLNYLSMKKIYWILESKNNPFLECTPVKPTLFAFIKHLRSQGIHYLRSQFPPELASLSAALIFGDQSLFDPNVLADYQSIGIIHLLAISGQHVSLLVGMVFYCGLRLGLTRQFMINLLLMILPIYSILTGAAPSILRSVLMIFLVLLTLKWKNKWKLYPLDALSLTLMILMFGDPFIIYDVGFLLSFSVCLAILLSGPIIIKQYQGNITRMFIISLIAQLAALPILLYYYFQIPIIGIAANLLFIPLFSFLFLPGVYSLFFIHLIFGASPSFLVELFIKIIKVSNQFLFLLANVPISHIVLGRPTCFFLIFYLLLILAIFLLWEIPSYPNKKRSLLILAFLLLIIPYGWNHFTPIGEVTMIDVGQGDSFFIRLPLGKGNVLIDTGGTVTFGEEEWKKRSKPYEVGRDVVVPYLKGEGITTIDKLILTHGDMDHIGGALAVIKEFHVKQIFMPSVVNPSHLENLIVNAAEKKGISVKKVSEGVEWTSGKASFYILSPEKNYIGERNGGSIAFYAEIGGLTWFFGGDLDQEGEEKIIKKYPKLAVNVLKAGHHGSKTSSADDFIAQLKPEIALISVGEHNRFGHPHREVLEKLMKINAVIYRTDQQGAITYRFFHDKGTFSAYLP